MREAHSAKIQFMSQQALTDHSGYHHHKTSLEAREARLTTTVHELQQRINDEQSRQQHETKALNEQLRQQREERDEQQAFHTRQMDSLRVSMQGEIDDLAHQLSHAIAEAPAPRTPTRTMATATQTMTTFTAPCST